MVQQCEGFEPFTQYGLLEKPWNRTNYSCQDQSHESAASLSSLEARVDMKKTAMQTRSVRGAIAKKSKKWTKLQDKHLAVCVEKVVALKNETLQGRPDKSRFYFWLHVSHALLALDADSPRTAKSCRERWINHAKPGLNDGAFSVEEDEFIRQFLGEHGRRWAEMARRSNNRSEAALKNRFFQLQKLDRSLEGIDSLLEEMSAVLPPDSPPNSTPKLLGITEADVEQIQDFDLSFVLQMPYAEVERDLESPPTTPIRVMQTASISVATPPAVIQVPLPHTSVSTAWLQCKEKFSKIDSEIDQRNVKLTFGGPLDIKISKKVKAINCAMARASR